MEIVIKYFIDKVIDILKLPIKVPILILNLIPYPKVWEVHGLRGNTKSNRPDLRAIYVFVKGQRQLNLGFIIIAYVNCYIFDADVNLHGLKVKGVHTEDFDDIVNRWKW